MNTMKNDMDLNEKVGGTTEKNAEQEKQAGKKRAASRKSFRWTAVDSVILLMVLLALAGVIARSFMPTPQSEAAKDAKTYIVEFTIPDIHRTVLEEIKAGDAVYLYETDELLGYIGTYEDGVIALKETAPVVDKNGYVSAQGSLVCFNGIYQNSGLSVKGTGVYLATGTALTLRTDRVVFSFEVTKITEEKEKS